MIDKMEEKALVVNNEAALPVALSAKQVIQFVETVQGIMKGVMKEGIDKDYAVIPGCKKPSLLKPGAEKLCLTFRLSPSYDVDTDELGNGHRECKTLCSLKHITTGQFFGQGVGSCSTMESKYRYRPGPVITTGKSVPKEYWNKRKTDPKGAQKLLGGSEYSTKKVEGNWEIVEQGEKMENPDIADTYNTVLKMSKKRALIDAILTAVAASDIFTQDIEEKGKTGDQQKTTKTPDKGKAPAKKSTETKKATKNGGANEPPETESTLTEQQQLLQEQLTQKFGNQTKNKTAWLQSYGADDIADLVGDELDMALRAMEAMLDREANNKDDAGTLF